MMIQDITGLVTELCSIRESVCDGKKSMKPWRTSGGPKKFAVCVGGKVVRFGDPNLEIKRDSASRRKNFRARHGCGTRPNTKDPKKAGYWACKTWERKKTVGDVVEQRRFKLLKDESVRSRTDPGMGGPPHSGGHPVGSPAYAGSAEWRKRASTMRPGKKPPQVGYSTSRSHADWEKPFRKRDARRQGQAATREAGQEYIHQREQPAAPEKPRPVPGSVPGRKTYAMVGEDKEKIDRSVPELAFKAREKAQDDEKAGHKEGADYWRGWAAGSFLTGNKGLERGPLNLIGG